MVSVQFKLSANGFLFPLSSPQSPTLFFFSLKFTAVGAITTGVCWRSGGRRSRGRTVIANATEKEEQGKDSPAFNPFGFVTDNPSSRSAIQLPESPAEDGNVGQMLYVRPLYFLWLWVVFIVFFWCKFYRLSCFFIFFYEFTGLSA